MAWADVDIEPLLPKSKAYSIVRRGPPFDEHAAVKAQEVDDLDDAATPDLPDTVWMAYDRDGNSQALD